MIRIKTQEAIIKDILQGKTKGIYNGNLWDYSITEAGQHLLWLGKAVTDISKRLNKIKSIPVKNTEKVS